MSFKNIFSIVLSIVMIACSTIIVNATETKHVYAITDKEVIIDSVYYEITNNTISYKGITYTVGSNNSLYSYDEYGNEKILVLPNQETRITDIDEIAKLNAMINESQNSKSTRAIPSSPKALPYTCSVPEGQWYTVTPYFNVINSGFKYYTVLKLSNLPLKSDKRFKISFTVYDSQGNWITNSTETQNFTLDSTIAFLNVSTYRYGVMTITNLYGDPSPSYTYKIYLSDKQS